MAESTPTAGASLAATWHRDLLTAVQGWKWLDTLNERVSAVVQPLYGRYRDNLAVELLHGGRWAGHALHPALSDLPIGLWTGTAVLDTLSKNAAVPERRLDPAGTLSAAGLVGAAATVVTGLADWNVSDGDDRKIGLFHGVLNAAGVTLQCASLAARTRGHGGSARLLSASSLLVTAAAGYIGGHLVQGRGAMVNRVAVAGVPGPNRWVRAIAEVDLAEGELTGVEVEGRRVLLCRAGEDVYAIDNICSHAGGVLSRGEINGYVITCPMHGARYDVRDGHVVRGPAHHPQPSLPTRIRNEWIEVRGSLPRPRRAKT